MPPRVTRRTRTYPAFDAGLTVEQRLSLVYAPRDRRAGLAALWALDRRMAALSRAGRDPMLTAIKLAWWREQLGALDSAAPPAEPLLRALAGFPPGTGEILADLPAAWGEMAGGGGAMTRHTELRGASLAKAAGALLGFEPSMLMIHAAEGFALSDLAATAPPAERETVAAMSRERFAAAGRFSWPRKARPFSMIVELARAALSSNADPGSPARIGRMAWHALSGR